MDNKSVVNDKSVVRDSYNVPLATSRPSGQFKAANNADNNKKFVNDSSDYISYRRRINSYKHK